MPESVVEQTQPQGELAIRTVAMPADTNPNGDIFGGWVLSQMDMAGGMIATRRAHGRVATVAIATMSFHRPVFVGDEVSCYGEITRIGNTSITIKVESWVRRGRGGDFLKVTEGLFTFVAIDEDRRPRKVPPE
ncbi:MAG TPA: acyl-CoA thioesterase [Hyphomicrobiaceae bacterium]